MELDFHPLCPAYQKNIDRLLSITNNQTCDYCLATVFLYTALEDVQVAEDDIAIYIKGIYNDEFIFFSPLCEVKDFGKAIERLHRYSQKNNIVLKFYAIKENVIQLLKGDGLSDEEITNCLAKEYFKTTHFCFENSRDSAEYIYSPKKLIELSGSDYKSKRNEISQFTRQYEDRYCIRPMEESDIPNVIKLVESWSKAKEFAYNDEPQRIKYILDNKEDLHLDAVVLLVDNQIIAASIYSVMASNVGDELFERCKPEYRNAYPLIAQFVAKKLENCSYINFEEDLGLSGLRFSKSSYKPDFLLEKFIVSENLEPKLKKIYQHVFGDSDEFTKEIFSEHSQCSCTALELKDNKVASCIFYRKKKLRILDQIYDLPFLFALATEPDYRNQGLAKKVVTRILNMINDNNYGFASLYPFPVSREFYEKMDFITFNYAKKYKISDILLQNTEIRYNTIPDSFKLTELFNNTCKDYNIAQFRALEDTEKMINEANAYQGIFIEFYYNNKLYGYVLKSDDEIEETIFDINFIQANKTTKFDESNCEETIKDILSEDILICSNEPLHKLNNNIEVYLPYTMIRPVDTFQFASKFTPFMDTTKELNINLFIEDNMIGNTIINVVVENRIAKVHAYANEKSENNMTISVKDLANWCFGLKDFDSLPKINKDLITTKYKDTY